MFQDPQRMTPVGNSQLSQLRRRSVRIKLTAQVNNLESQFANYPNEMGSHVSV